jgi:hypothetical protein
MEDSITSRNLAISGVLESSTVLSRIAIFNRLEGRYCRMKDFENHKSAVIDAIETRKRRSNGFEHWCYRIPILRAEMLLDAIERIELENIFPECTTELDIDRTDSVTFFARGPILQCAVEIGAISWRTPCRVTLEPSGYQLPFFRACPIIITNRVNPVWIDDYELNVEEDLSLDGLIGSLREFERKLNG